jgi:hypothetical protein
MYTTIYKVFVHTPQIALQRRTITEVKSALQLQPQLLCKTQKIVVVVGWGPNPQPQ